jgi:hypothetical protein
LRRKSSSFAYYSLFYFCLIASSCLYREISANYRALSAYSASRASLSGSFSFNLAATLAAISFLSIYAYLLAASSSFNFFSSSSFFKSYNFGDMSFTF